MTSFEPNRTVDLHALQKVLGGGLIWAALAFFLIALLIFTSIRIGRVTGEEVGVLLNKMNGKTEVINRPGVHLYNGITHHFYVLDKTLQTLEMTEVPTRGERTGKDDLKIKTQDGSDVYVDLIVQYRIDANQADIVLETSGPGQAFKETWARDFVRSLCRNSLGELTTEEFYDSAKRDGKIRDAHMAANDRLTAFGIFIDSVVIPKNPHFYAEYEEMIKKKKLADQAVLQEQSKALAAKQRQEFAVVEETNRTNVAIEQYKGEMQQQIIKAEAAAYKARMEAESYHKRVTVGAEAFLYQKQQEAEGIRTKKSKEAEGIEELKKAMEGEGGRNMVKLEYARRLKDLAITGQPYTLDMHTERFQHSSAPASASGPTGRPARRP